MSLGRAHLLASAIAREARRAGLPFDELHQVGGLRRCAPELDDIALLVIAPRSNHAHLLRGFTTLSSVTTTSTTSSGAPILATERGALTLHMATPRSAGSALIWHTGADDHLSQLRARAATYGLEFDSAELVRGSAPIECPTEADFYGQLGLPYIPPELRHGADEIDRALQDPLPDLVYDGDIRGDLHVHSTWSDGRDPIEDMVRAARRLGYEYIAITDHSERAAASRTLAADDVVRQRTEIEALRLRVAGIQILHGVEVDIMPDGRLDFDDGLLQNLDFVLASLHNAAGQDGTALTERYIRAMRHPLVNVITHPANRSPARSDGYDLDYERLFEAAIATGTAMEIDGAPGHLDMDGAVAQRAAAAGVTLTISSDAHRAEWLGRQMSFGTGTARRGWVTPRQVLNTRSMDEVRAFVARKRARA